MYIVPVLFFVKSIHWSAMRIKIYLNMLKCNRRNHKQSPFL